MATPRRTTIVAFALAAAAVLLATPGALGQSLSERHEAVQDRIESLQGKIEEAKHEEGVLTGEIDAASEQIDSLEGDIDALAARVDELEADLARHRARLAALEERYREQTRHLNRLVRDHAIAQRRLQARLVEVYQSGQDDALSVLLQVESLGALIEQIDLMNEIGRQDQRITAELKRLKIAMREARERTAAIREEVAAATAVLADKTEEAQDAHAELVAQQAALAAARAEKSDLLAGVRDARHEHEEDLDALLAASAQLEAQIQAAQSSGGSSSGGGGSSGGGASSSGGDTTPSSSGLIWPVSGTVTSGFGMRWGRMHEGIDIAAPTGTTVVAAASGRVIIAGSMGGYGNIVVIDHGGGLSTAYAHLSSIWVGGGSVSQGQGIGAVGCTGSCTGPHLHFEVRVNGSAVNPLAYL